MQINLGKYRKAILAALAACGVTGTVLTDGAVSLAEVGTLVVAWGAVFGVYQVPNDKN